MTAHPFTLAAVRRKAAARVQDRYIVEFRLDAGIFDVTPWFLAQEEHLPESPEEVFGQIAEHHPMEGRRGTITFADGLGHMRVTKLCGATGRFMDVTSEMSRAFGHWRLAQRMEWPSWARDFDDREEDV